MSLAMKKKFLAVFEVGANNLSGFLPDVPGVVSTATLPWNREGEEQKQCPGNFSHRLIPLRINQRGVDRDSDCRLNSRLHSPVQDVFGHRVRNEENVAVQYRLGP